VLEKKIINNFYNKKIIYINNRVKYVVIYEVLSKIEICISFKF